MHYSDFAFPPFICKLLHLLSKIFIHIFDAFLASFYDNTYPSIWQSFTDIIDVSQDDSSQDQKIHILQMHASLT